MSKSKPKNQIKVKQYPFNPQSKKLYTPTETEINKMCWSIQGWTPKEPKYHILREILKEHGYLPAEYEPLAFSEVVELLSIWTGKSMRQIVKATSNSGRIIRDHMNAAKPKIKITNPEQQPKPLTKKGRLIYEKLNSLNCREAMTLPEIQDWLYEKHNINLDEGTWKQIRKEMEPYGLYNRKRVGYYLKK